MLKRTYKNVYQNAQLVVTRCNVRALPQHPTRICDPRPAIPGRCPRPHTVRHWEAGECSFWSEKSHSENVALYKKYTVKGE